MDLRMDLRLKVALIIDPLPHQPPIKGACVTLLGPFPRGEVIPKGRHREGDITFPIRENVLTRIKDDPCKVFFATLVL